MKWLTFSSAVNWCLCCSTFTTSASTEFSLSLFLRSLTPRTHPKTLSPQCSWRVSTPSCQTDRKPSFSSRLIRGVTVKKKKKKASEKAHRAESWMSKNPLRMFSNTHTTSTHVPWVGGFLSSSSKRTHRWLPIDRLQPRWHKGVKELPTNGFLCFFFYTIIHRDTLSLRLGVLEQYLEETKTRIHVHFTLLYTYSMTTIGTQLEKRNTSVVFIEVLLQRKPVGQKKSKLILFH